MSGRPLIFSVIILIFTVSQVSADTPSPLYSHSKQTRSGKYLFVMISPLSPEFDGKWEREPKASEIREIRKTYNESGLYRNDGSTTPLWTVDWYAHGTEPFSDGIHLVRKGPWATSPDSEAVSFFANGVLIRTYTVQDLVANPKNMPHSVSHFTWRYDEELNDHDKTYKITTKHFEYYLFDATTGKIISTSAPFQWAPSILGVFLISAFSYWWWRRKYMPNKRMQSDK